MPLNASQRFAGSMRGDDPTVRADADQRPPADPPSANPVQPDESTPQVRLSFLEYVTFLFLALSLVFHLFTQPIVGLASNGDYARITDQVGLYYADDPENENTHLVREYALRAPDDWSGYVSSEVLPVRAALLVNRIVSKDGLFDIRVMGAVHSVLFLLGAGLILFAARRFGVLPRVMVCTLLLLFFSDVAYVAYFNSFYSEAASLIFLFLVVGFGLVLITRDQAPTYRITFLGLFFVASALLVMAKPQNAVLGIPLAIIGYRLAHVPILPSRQDHRRQLVAAAMSLALIAASFLGYSVGQPERFREANLFNMVFNEILRTSAAPDQDLEALGLDRNLIAYAGTTAYDPGNPLHDRTFHARFFDRTSYGKIVAFYMRRPGRFVDLARRGAGSTVYMRPQYLGNFEASTNLPPYSQSQAFATWSNRKPQLLPNSLTFLAAFFGASLIVAASAHRVFRRSRSLRLVAEFHSALVIMAGAQFLIVILGEGEFEIIKHLYLFHALFDMSLVFLAFLSAMLGMTICGSLTRHDEGNQSVYRRLRDHAATWLSPG